MGQSLSEQSDSDDESSQTNEVDGTYSTLPQHVSMAVQDQSQHKSITVYGGSVDIQYGHCFTTSSNMDNIRHVRDGKESARAGYGIIDKSYDNGKYDGLVKVPMKGSDKKPDKVTFLENDKDNRSREIDLHGLCVKEVIPYIDEAIQKARYQGDKEIYLIVGRGLFSTGGASSVRSAIETLLQEKQLATEIDPLDAGVLIVQLNFATYDKEPESGKITEDI